jgi:hypothetical protein
MVSTPERRRLVAMAMGAFWLVSGVWPILHMRSFMWVTGPKVDAWLVRTVGALIAAIGLGLVQSARGDDVPREVETIAVAGALSLASVDVVYVARGRIGPIYLLDAFVELVLVALWRLARAPGKAY